MIQDRTGQARTPGRHLTLTMGAPVFVCPKAVRVSNVQRTKFRAQCIAVHLQVSHSRHRGLVDLGHCVKARVSLTRQSFASATSKMRLALVLMRRTASAAHMRLFPFFLSPHEMLNSPAFQITDFKFGKKPIESSRVEEFTNFHTTI